jgi:hypothetical protein
MAVLNNTKINVIKNNIAILHFTNIEREFGLSGDITLSQKNNIGGGNDKQLKNIFNHYPDLQNTVECYNSPVIVNGWNISKDTYKHCSEVND